MKTLPRHRATAIAAMTSLGLLGVSATNAAPASSPGSAAVLEEIVVTASKRSESLEKVPSSVTALTAKDLEREGLVEFSQYANRVPGLSTLGSTAPGFGQVILRGITTGGQQLSATVGYYLDETPVVASGSLALASLVTPDPDLTDIERIEVLKGPQATLYGASTLGGLIKIVSNKPVFNEFNGSVRLDGSLIDGGGSGYGVRGVVNVPIIDDRLALRVAAFRREGPGFTSNVRSGGENLNESTASGARIGLRLKLAENAEVNLNGFVQNLSADSASAVDLDINTLSPIYNENEYSLYFDPRYKSQYRVLNLTAMIGLGTTTLTASSSYSTNNNKVFTDYTAIYGPLLAFYRSLGVPIPANTGVTAVIEPNSRKLTHELRLASANNESLEWLAGAFYTDESNDYGTFLSTVDLASGVRIPPPFGDFYSSPLESTYREAAAFGDVTYYLTPKVDVTVGARYSENRQTYSGTISGILNGFAAGTRANRSKDTSDTYLATVRWRPSEELNLYARAASAYRPGGPQTTCGTGVGQPPCTGVVSTFKPDTVWNYEVGAKARWFDGRLAADLAVYQIDWKDIQLNALVGGRTITGNAGKASSEGVELGIKWMATPGLAISAGAAYNDAKVDSSQPTVGAVSGDPLPFAPQWTASTSLDYERNVFEGWRVAVGSTFNYQGSRYTSFSGDALNTRLNLPSYSTLDVRAGLLSEKFDILLRVENATDEFGVTSASVGRIFPGQPAMASASVIRPRTYGLSVTARF